MPRTSRIIAVPKPEEGSFNPDRPLAGNLLLANQVQHFHQVEMKLPVERRTGISRDDIKTEGQASEYIRKMHRILIGTAVRAGGR